MAASLLAVVLICSVTGCGKEEKTGATVTGKVTVDGVPVPEGTIIFSPSGQTKGQAAVGTITNGDYTAENVPLGELNVTFNANKKIGDVPEVRSSAMEPVTESIIPLQYVTTGVSFTVTQAEEMKDFELTKQAPRGRRR